MWKFINKAATETEPESVELKIEGDIVSDNDVWLYEWFGDEHTSKNKFKNELSSHEGKPITVWIDSYGGDVFAAAGIYNALKEHKGKITVKIDGKAMSAASVIAMAGDEILMSPVGMLMIHNPLTYAEGDMHELRHVADILDTVKDTIINAYQMKTGKSRNKIAEMMDNETFMSAKQAKKEGFIDGVLYENEPDKVEALNLSFNRLAIVNSAKSIMTGLEKIENTRQQEENKTEAIKAKLALQLLL